MQLTTKHTEEHNDSKRETISFYGFPLSTLLCKVELKLFSKKITRGHRELLEIKSLFKVKNTSVNSVVIFKRIFWVNKAGLHVFPRTIHNSFVWFTDKQAHFKKMQRREVPLGLKTSDIIWRQVCYGWYSIEMEGEQSDRSFL